MNFSTDNYWLNIDKPIGFSSAKVVAIVKGITNAKKVGHGGTLDPFASGVLPIALNRATKTSQQLLNSNKKYQFTITYKEFRDTDDVEGKIQQTSDKVPSTNELAQILIKFIGKISQTPSKFSAIKINGNRAYDLARKGQDFEMPSREVEIFMLKLIENNSLEAKLEVECSKGTYIRSLARAICVELKICGYVSSLRRVNVGNFSINQIISLDELKAKVHNGIALSNYTILT